MSEPLAAAVLAGQSDAVAFLTELVRRPTENPPGDVEDAIEWLAHYLAGRGHDVKMGEPWTEGRIAAVGRDGPFLTAGASPRGMQNYAAGR